MAGTKRKYDDLLTAEEFFRNIELTVPNHVEVPNGCTVKDIREIVFRNSNAMAKDYEWMDEFSGKNLRLIVKIVNEESSYVDILNCKRIVYTTGSEKELKIQQRLGEKKQLIDCKTDSETSGSDDNDTTARCGDSISLVLGPSGSGKTTFCANVSIKSTSTGKEFRVYMYSNDLIGTEGPEARLRMILNQQIRKALELSEEESLCKLDMTLYAIIDEAGHDAYFADIHNLTALKGVVDKFASDGQLVLSGTGLDLLTTDIGSTGEGINKIRMMPWSVADFAKLAKDGDMVQLVKNHFVYGAMVSNARAASFLLKWLVTTEKWGEPDENVPNVLRGVAYGYISGNGLKDLNDRSRRKVARAVFKVLDACVYDNPEIPAFEENRTLLSEDELSKAKSLIDVHVKKTGTEIKLHDGHHYAVSVTPAIALVLATLLGSSASLVHRWAGFEAVAALNELFKLAREVESEEVPEYKIVQLDRPYQATKTSKTLLVPVMDPFTVLVNGERASFADVIAHYRLIQAKHCENSNGTAQLYIKDELMKMGLLKCSPFAKKVFARSLYQIWKTYTVSLAAQQEQATEHGSGEALEVRQDRSLYPASLLISERIKKKPVCWEFKEHGTKEKPEWSSTGDAENLRNMKCMEWVDNWVDSDKPLTVVFVTNGQKFQVYQKEENSRVHQGDLDTEGTLRHSNGEIQGDRNLSDWTTNVLKTELITGVNVELVFARA